MKNYWILICIIILFSCSENADDKHVESHSENTNDTEEKSNEYTLIKDNLYSDNEGNLYLKSINNEDLENGTKYDVWLKTVYCDTCWTPTENGWTDITELKDFVDVNSFHLDTTDHKRGGDFYEDKNHKYFHKWMADGGTITLLEK